MEKTDNNEIKILHLPRRHYGPICAKLLTMFMDHHNINPQTPIPNPEDKNHIAISKIFNIMALSMGKDKSKAMINDAEEYCSSLPPILRD